MKDKILFYLKRLPVAFLLVALSFFSIYSISSFFASENLASFKKALDTSEESLYDKKIIVGLKNDLAMANDDNSPQKILKSDGVISYKVAINNESNSYLLNEEQVTPIESSIMRYFWTDTEYPSSTIQGLYISYVNGYKNFEDDLDSIIISSSLYKKLDKPQNVSIYSPALLEYKTFHVAGFYNDDGNLNKTVVRLFYEVYQEPIFFNSSTFKEFTCFEENQFSHIQTDLVINSSNNYSVKIDSIFKTIGWEKDFVKYEQFNDVFNKMEAFNARNKGSYLAIGFIAIFVLASIIVTLCIFNQDYLTSLISATHPCLLLVFWFISAFLVYFAIRQLLKGILFFESSFGIVFAVSLVLFAVQIVAYYFLKHKEIENE